MTVLARDERACLGLVTHAVQMLERLPVDQPAERPRASRGRRARAVPESRPAAPARIGRHTRFDSFGNDRRRRRQRHCNGAIVRQRRDGGCEMRGQRFAGQKVDLERANQAFAIAREDAPADGGSTRINMRCRNSTPRRPAIASSRRASPHRRLARETARATSAR